MRNFTDSLFEDLTETDIKQFTDVPGATRLLNDVIQRISYVLYDDFKKLYILPEHGSISNNVWECNLVFNDYNQLPSFLHFLEKINKYLTDYYKKHNYSYIFPTKDAKPDENGIYTEWQLANNASVKAIDQFNNVLRFIEDKNNYLKYLLNKIANNDKVDVSLATTTPTTYTNNDFNLTISIKIDLTRFESAIDICQELNTADTKEILSYLIINQNKYFTTSSILEYINKYVNYHYGNYFKNGVSLFQYLINALNQEVDLVTANTEKVNPFKEDNLGKLLTRKLVTGDPDLTLSLKPLKSGDDKEAELTKFTADAKIYGENADSRYETNHTSDYLFAVQLGNNPHWVIYTKEDNYREEHRPTDIRLFAENELVFPNITLVKFKSESDNNRSISADKISDNQLPKFVSVNIEPLNIEKKCSII